MEHELLLDATAIVLTRFLGIFFTITGLGFAVNGSYFKHFIGEFTESRSIQLIFALIPLIIGSLIVSHYNVWSGKHLIVTITGWLFLASGTFRLCFVKTWVHFAKKMLPKANLQLWGAIITLVGMIYLYLGYGI